MNPPAVQKDLKWIHSARILAASLRGIVTCRKILGLKIIVCSLGFTSLLICVHSPQLRISDARPCKGIEWMDA
ncbi:hypothetical protein BDR03DRAFT_974446 [Suillus americanus]|nr:hypothetical protein BDR03DRAFT_974446 [Suillus americanus]